MHHDSNNNRAQRLSDQRYATFTKAFAPVRQERTAASLMTAQKVFLQVYGRLSPIYRDDDIFEKSFFSACAQEGGWDGEGERRAYEMAWNIHKPSVANAEGILTHARDHLAKTGYVIGTDINHERTMRTVFHIGNAHHTIVQQYDRQPSIETRSVSSTRHKDGRVRAEKKDSCDIDELPRIIGEWWSTGGRYLGWWEDDSTYLYAIDTKDLRAYRIGASKMQPYGRGAHHYRLETAYCGRLLPNGSVSMEENKQGIARLGKIAIESSLGQRLTPTNTGKTAVLKRQR